MFRNKLLKALDVYLDELDDAIDALQNARQTAIDAKAALLRGENVDAIGIPTIEEERLYSAVKYSARVDVHFMMASDAANERT